MTPPETCDKNGTGPAACPAACSDGNACTTDALVGSAANCTAQCVFTDITQPKNADGCCPAGANANNDNDCTPKCGNGTVEAGEQCEPPGSASCSAQCQNVVVATAFLFTDLDLRDPHIYYDADFLCPDVTDSVPFNLATPVNTLLQDAIRKDATDDDDNYLDLSPLVVFRPLAQGSASTNLDVLFGDCLPPYTAATCTPSEGPVFAATGTNLSSGTCLGTVSSSTSGYSPGITKATAPCFSSAAQNITIDLAGIKLTLKDARVGATYTGNPATGMVNGLLRGFLSEADAEATVIPMSVPGVGGQTIASLLAGGDGNCSDEDDRDTHNGETGWWFYLNFTATRLGPPNAGSWTE